MPDTHLEVAYDDQFYFDLLNPADGDGDANGSLFGDSPIGLTTNSTPPKPASTADKGKGLPLPLPPAPETSTVSGGEYMKSKPVEPAAPYQLTLPPLPAQDPVLMLSAHMNGTDATTGDVGLGIASSLPGSAFDAMPNQVVSSQQASNDPFEGFSHLRPSVSGANQPLTQQMNNHVSVSDPHRLRPKVDKFDDKLSNKRTKNRPNPQDFYHPTPRREAWGPPDHRQRPMFRYTEFGELEGDIRFNKDSLGHYMQGCKQKNIPLRIWIQHPPSQSNWRYPLNAESSKCRSHECPVNNRSVLKGMIRVAFDERPADSGVIHDPFHCAGYMHLFCLEKIVNIYKLMCTGVMNMMPDTRVLHCEDINPMALNRDDDGLVYEFRKWQEDQATIRNPDGEFGAIPFDKDRDLLVKRLTAEHMRLQTAAREAARDDRKRTREDEGGIITDIGVWGGDLEHYAQLKRSEVNRKRDARDAEKARLRKKRKAQSGDAIEISDDEDLDEGVRVLRSHKRPRADPIFGQVDYQQQPEAPSTDFDLRPPIISPRDAQLDYQPAQYHTSELFQMAYEQQIHPQYQPYPQQHQVPPQHHLPPDYQTPGHQIPQQPGPGAPPAPEPAPETAPEPVPEFEGPITRRRSKILAANGSLASPRLPAIDENAAYPPKRETARTDLGAAPLNSPGPHGPGMDQRLLRPRRKREWADFDEGGDNHILARWEVEKYNYKRTARKRGRYNSLPF
ncbi:uncharacterized protein E0L32_005768 [Thyridium curvatum]|uniref:Uncharacterized protein n=1 Tax=Thyridium curvatum TaxID=1093900 RepID=A0A507B548_9PEZI|nr:uncharacterized protein E0L32_005768 [Thyridium curvatum]TPX13824.1 hypothetical protein E0L32_005768 [Thyridium curvatum]